MKISLNWVKEYTDVKLPLDELVEKIGAQLGAVDEVIDIGKNYKGIVIVKVVSCIKHPNADKLKLCIIDDGNKVKNVKRDSKGLIQVVCGAPNVKAGMLAAWLPPGLTVPATADKEPLILEAREIRGEVSNGMLASLHELAIGDDHSGILEIDVNAKPGDNFAEIYELSGDKVIDIENKMFTHRPDCFGFLGVARELAGIQNMAFTSPEWYKENPVFPKPETKRLNLKLKNEIPALVPRFSAIAMTNIEVRPSPLWLQIELSKVGVRPINNIVDLTNFFMLETAQPLHAYDYDKVGGEILVRKAKKDEKLRLLGDKEIELRSEDIVISDGKRAIGLGGVMGGADTEVDENTKNIILECANFDMYAIRRTAMEHGLFTDAVTRFTKGQSPLQTLAVLAKTVDDIQKLGGRIAGPLQDTKRGLKSPEPVKVTADFINERLGLKLAVPKIIKLLENVEFKVMPLAGKQLGITPPFWRTDIHIAEDIVEEVGRLYGYDHLPLDLPKRNLSPAPKDKTLEFKKLLREILPAAGANELLTYSFVHGDLMKKAGQNPNNAFKIANALSPDLQYYRQSLLPSLLDKVHPNIKTGVSEFALFEINQTHAKDLIGKDSLPIEEYRLGLVFAAESKTAKANYEAAPYYQAKKYLDVLLEKLGIEARLEPMITREPKMEVGKAAAAPFERQRSAYVMSQDGKLLGEIGEFKASVTSKFKLPGFASGFELDVLQLMNQQDKTSGYTAIPRFPVVNQDISLQLPSDKSYEQLLNLVNAQIEKLKPEHTSFNLSPVDIYQDDNDKSTKHITLRLEIASYQRTLQAELVNELLDKVAAVAKAKLGAQRL